MSGRKRQALSISDKIKILKVTRGRDNKKRVDFAKELGIPASTLNSIISKGKEIEVNARAFGTSSSKIMRIQGGKYLDLEDALLQWFQQYRAEGIPISNPLCEKATEIGLRLDLENVQTSSGWLHKFKLRHEICCKSVCGESGSLNPDAVSA
ncbi:hypothetical protein R5R35_007547 [Gryllus longicercus]|uniref:HTH CENPB-type domain-containing protein n=1 Tax=Gryllus longicercus TaxID=2509291 RepID=A0AAN9ZEK7_9ORTH